MSLLEDRILRIIELKQKGSSDTSIAQELGIAESTVCSYEVGIKEMLQKYNGESILRMVQASHFSFTAVNIVAKHYGIHLNDSFTPLIKKKEAALDRIRLAIAAGADSVDTIAALAELAVNTVRVYASQEQIRLPAVGVDILRRRRKEDAIYRIRQTVADGADSLQGIAAASGLAENTIQIYACQGDIALPRVRKNPRRIRKEDIDDALAAGVRSMDELVQKLGRSHYRVYTFCQHNKIALPFRLTTKPDSEKIGILRAACQEEGITLDALCEKTGYSGQTISRMVAKCHIPLSPSIKEQIKIKLARLEYDVLIAQGVPLRDIAERVGCTHQNVNQYIRKTGQHEAYKLRRKEIGSHGHKDAGGLIQPSFRKHYLFLLEERITQLCKKKGFAYEKAWQYVQSCTANQSTPFKELVQFFDNYDYSQKILDQFGGLEEAKRHGVKPLSFTELCEPFGWHEGYAGFILRKVGLEPLYGKSNTPSRKVSIAKKARILACFGSPLSQTDLAYFAGILGFSVHQYFSEKKVGRHTKLVKTFDTFHGERVLTYRLASQIYEADDAGFNQGEIESYAKIHAKAVAYALEHRTEITPVIVNVLKKLYPTENITSPYRYKYGIEDVIEKELLT